MKNRFDLLIIFIGASNANVISLPGAESHPSAPQRDSQHALAWKSEPSYEDLTPVPGTSPFKYCDDNYGDDLFTISEIWVWTNPLFIADFWDFTMKGVFAADIPADSQVNIRGRINLTDYPEPLDMAVNFCKLVDKVTQPAEGEIVCPPKKGEALIQREDYMLWSFPEATYIFTLDMFMPDGKRVFCIHTEAYLQKEHPPPELKE